eukprot:scaffold63488_cov51-Attheya_sp.AAC.6
MECLHKSSRVGGKRDGHPCSITMTTTILLLTFVMAAVVTSQAGFTNAFSFGLGSVVRHRGRNTVVGRNVVTNLAAKKDGDEDAMFDKTKDGIYNALDSFRTKDDDAENTAKPKVVRPIDKLMPPKAPEPPASPPPFFVTEESYSAANPVVFVDNNTPPVTAKFPPKPERPSIDETTSLTETERPFDKIFDVIDFAKTIPSKLSLVAEQAQKVAKETAKTIQAVPGQAEKTVGEIKGTIEETVEAIQAVPDKVQKSVDNTNKKVEETVESIQAIPGTVQKTVDQTKQKVGETVETIQAIPSNVQKTVNETQKNVESTVQTIQSIPGNVQKSVDKTVRSVEQTIETIQAIPGNIQKSVDATKATVEQTKNSVINTAKAVEETANKIKNMAKGVKPPKKELPVSLEDVDARLDNEVNDALELAKKAINSNPFKKK